MNYFQIPRSNLIPRSGDIYSFKIANSYSCFQVVAVKIGYHADDITFIVKVFPFALTRLDDNVIRYFQNHYCPYWFLKLESSYKFHREFCFITRDVSIPSENKDLPQYVVSPNSLNLDPCDSIPPSWWVAPITYNGIFAHIGDFAKIGRLFPNVDYRICLYYEYGSHDKFKWSVKHANKPNYCGINSLEIIIKSWPVEIIDLWFSSFESRLQNAKSDAEIKTIENDFTATVRIYKKSAAINQPQRFVESSGIVDVANSNDSKAFNASVSMGFLRKEANSLKRLYREREDLDKDAFAQICDVLDQLLSSVSRKRGDQTNLNNSLTSAVANLNSINDDADGSMIETEERELLVDFLINVGLYVGFDVAELVDNERDW